MPSAAQSRTGPPGRTEELLERATTFFESVLWESEAGSAALARLARHGLDVVTLRRFRVGYAPGNTGLLAEHLRDWDYTDDELVTAGIGIRSDRERVHLIFHARLMFPIQSTDGAVLGFTGLGTHLGPSWPLWLTSADGHGFRRGVAIFAIGEASTAIREARRALVLRDPVQVLALHQSDRRDAVAVIQSPITREHLEQLADALDVDRRDLHLARRDGSLGVVVLPDLIDPPREWFADRAIPAGFSLINSNRARVPAASATRDAGAERAEPPPRTRLVVYIASIMIGVGIPIGGLLVANARDEGGAGSPDVLNLTIVGVAVAYAVLALVVARMSARVRARSTTRRMRLPWVRGSDEVQPAGWTYHRVEEILVGAALASAITCVVLLLTVGGFLG
jgi:DNA primase catalytic core, N-terminal domain